VRSSKNIPTLGLAVILIAMAATLAGCSGSSAQSTGGDSPSVLAAQSPEGESASAMPSTLNTIEANAEDIIDLIPNGDWETIRTDVDEMNAAWKDYEPQADSDGASSQQIQAMDDALHALDDAVGKSDETASEQAANDASFAVVELFALYDPSIPAEIGRLDALERQVIIEAKGADLSAAADVLADAQATWDSVSGRVLDAGGAQAADAFEQSLALQVDEVGSGATGAAIDEAKIGLELVDDLEKVF